MRAAPGWSGVFIASLSAFGLSACGSSTDPVATANASPPAPEIAPPAPRERPSFRLNEVDAEEALLAVLPRATGEPLDRSEHDDSLTGGRAVSIVRADRSFHIFILPSGQVWRARLGLGAPGRCSPTVSRETLGAFVSQFAPAATPVDRAAAVDRLAGEAGAAALPGVQFQLARGCVTLLTATAADP